MSRVENEEDEIVKDALHLIKQGWAKLDSQCSSISNKDVIFVLGGTGAGKSSVTQIITGSLQKLYSKPGQHGAGLVIVDQVEQGTNGRIGDPQVASKTFLPEYLPCENVEKESSTDKLVFVDCPGFEDNRGTSMEIAAMVLIKKIAEQVDHARFLFVIPASTVSFTDMNRTAFSRLCSNATGFIRNVDKLKGAISLVVNKVNNHDPSTGIKIDDEDVIRNTTHFLEQVSKLQHSSLENQRLIEYLLKDRSKWILIHFPDKSGPLSEIDHFTQVREKIREICTYKLKKARVKSNDFAVTLSPESRYIIGKRLVPHMKTEIDRMVKELIIDMEKEFVARFQRDLEESHTTRLITLMEKLGGNCEKLKNIEKLEISENERVPVTFRVSMISKWLHISLAHEKMSELRKIEEQLELFQQTTEETDLERGSSVQITKSINSLKMGLEDLSKSTLKMVKESVIPYVESRVKDETRKMVKSFVEGYKLGFWMSLESGDEYCRQAIDKLVGDFSKFEIIEKDGIGHLPERGKLSFMLKKIGNDLGAPMVTESLQGLENELELLLKLVEQPSKSSEFGDSIIFPELRKRLQKLISEVQKKVRDEHIVMVHVKMTEQISELMGYLEKAFFEIFNQNLGIDTMPEKREILRSVDVAMEKVCLNEIVPGVFEMFQIFGHDVPESKAERLREYEIVLDFYDRFLGIPVPRPVENFMKSFRVLQRRFHEMNILYEFLELAKNTNPNTIEDNFEGDQDTVILRFLEALRATSDIRRIVQERATAHDKALIRNIAKYLGNGKTKLSKGHDNQLVVTGRNVKFSEFLDELGVPCGRSVRKVLVLASETVRLDRDVEAEGKQLTITVIADKWIVEGRRRTIQLSGSEGSPHLEPKAADGNSYEEKGRRGLVGNCGGNAGNFFGIYNELVNGESLSIYADGGNGGDGQAGGNGAEGMPAREIEENTSTMEKVSRALTTVAMPFLPNPFIRRRSAREGGKGGDGGDGGAGGEGGLEGFVKLIPLSVEVSLNKVSCRRGMRGDPGKGGSGGRGGRHQIGLGFTVFNPVDDVLSDSSGCLSIPRGPDGKDGRTGGNFRGRTSPPPQTIKDLHWRDVEAFRKYIKEECKVSTAGSCIIQLIDIHPGVSRPQLWLGQL